MNKQPEDQEPAFKVVDRRRFDEEGREKECCDHDHSHDHAHAHAHTHEAQPQPRETPTAREAMPMSFSLFIQTLAHQAMMGLGLVPWPDSGLVKQDKTLAKETIDLLQMLKSKTENNLDKNEQELLEGMLYQLQVAYVEIFK
jgi:hypothetical protein